MAVPLLLRLMEGGWWTFFAWFASSFSSFTFAHLDRHLHSLWLCDVHLGISLTILLPIVILLFGLLLYCHVPYPWHQRPWHQTTHQDVRLWIPKTFDITVPGLFRHSHHSWYRHKKSTSPFGHSQYSIRIRVRGRFVSLRYGFRFKPLAPHSSIRTLLRQRKKKYDLSQKPKTHKDLATPLQVHFDEALYDRELNRLKSRTYLHMRDTSTVTFFDEARCETTMKTLHTRYIERFETPSVIPTVKTYFDRTLYGKAEICFLKRFLSFQGQYGISRGKAWSSFDTMMDPLDWFRKLKEISEETAITPRTTQHARMNLAIKDAVHLQENLIPGLAMVARTASPMESQMSVTFV